MEYYYCKTVDFDFDVAVARVTEELKKDGFGILTEIDVQSTLKKKIDVDFRRYVILGACNPPFAYEAFQAEDKIGLMLPCNIIVQELEKGGVEVAAVNPIASMAAVKNEKLEGVALTVERKLKEVIERV
jgi:uncharacterized protein (DUF302 family)